MKEIIRLNEPTPLPTATQIAFFKESPRTSKLWNAINQLKGSEVEKTEFFINLLDNAFCRFEEAERNAPTNAQLREMAQKTATYWLWGIDEESYANLKDALRESVLEEHRLACLKARLVESLPADFVTQRWSLSERSLLESIKQKTQE